MTDREPKLPFESAVMPEVLDEDTEIRFRCYKGISCFNACCKSADVTLAPYDIIRLKRRMGMTSTDFLAKHTVPFQMDQDGLPGVKLKTRDDGTCLQLDGEAGCSVYEDRPTVCRYYPVALLTLREKGSSQAEERYALVKEDHCKGHEEDRQIRVGDFRAEQGCAEYDQRNREWYRLILKKRSAGPAVGKPPPVSLKLFFMASYDVDNFRHFVLSDGFRRTYVLPDGLYARLEGDDEALLSFGYRFLRQVLFGERTIEEVANAWAQRVENRRQVWEARRQAERERRMAEEDRKYQDGRDT